MTQDRQALLDEKRAMIAQLRKECRELKLEGVLVAGRARISPKAAPYAEVWQLGYQVPMQTHYGRAGGSQYKTLFTGTRQECIEAISEIIADLRDLEEKADKENSFLR